MKTVEDSQSSSYEGFMKVRTTPRTQWDERMLSPTDPNYATGRRGARHDNVGAPRFIQIASIQRKYAHFGLGYDLSIRGFFRSFQGLKGSLSGRRLDCHIFLKPTLSATEDSRQTGLLTGC
jgi:hypothetical protein